MYRTSPSSGSVIQPSPVNAPTTTTTTSTTDRMLTLPIDGVDVDSGSTLRPSSSGGAAQLTDASRSSISTVDSEGRVGASMLSQMSKRWSTLETAGRCMFLLSVAFLVIGVVLTVAGFAAGTSEVSSGFLVMQIIGPVCLATTCVMWALGAAFSRLWRTEWQRRQRAMELRARVQLHALAMDLLKKPALSPRVLQDPALRRQLLVKLRQQSAMEARSVQLTLYSAEAIIVPHQII